MLDQLTRAIASLGTRVQAALLAFPFPLPTHVNNGEEWSLPNFIANYSKGLRHNTLGEVDPLSDYLLLLAAITTGSPALFNLIPLGSTAPDRRRLVNPQAGLAFDLEGPDAWAIPIPPAPTISSDENSSEMAELYWMALLRDVNFTDYGTDTGLVTIADAATDLSSFGSAFKGRKQGGAVTPATAFRGFTDEDLVGPYISQFLLAGAREATGELTLDGIIRYGSHIIDQRQVTVKSIAQGGRDYLTNYNEWLDIQNGNPPTAMLSDIQDPTPRFIRNLRDLAILVRPDRNYQHYLNACLILQNIAPLGRVRDNSPLDPGNPYLGSPNQEGFATFGDWHILALLAEVSTRALKAVWYQKWFVHRRLRPEEFGGRIHNHLMGQATYPQINSRILTSPVIDKIRNYNSTQFGNDTYLLPQVFPEGSPLHPAYGSGHATVAGACVTVLKAWFDETALIKNPVVPIAAPDPAQDGTQLGLYTGADKDSLTVGGELNKLASNISIGRNGAGVHWRSDYTEAVKLGEKIAIGILQEQSLTYHEDRRGEAFFTLTRFDRTRIRIEDGQVMIIP